MRSMTGYGQAARSDDEADLRVEIRTLNSRYLDVNFRSPKELVFFEPELRKELQSRIARGRVDVYINLTLQAADKYGLNESLVRNYLAIDQELRSMGIKGSVDVAALLPLPGIIISRQTDLSAGTLLHTLVEAFREALVQVAEARGREGAVLKKDLERRIHKVLELTGCIAENVEQVTAHYREKLKRRIEDLSLKQVVDENRLSQEILYYVDRSDISEEITRLQSHITIFQEGLNVPHGQVVGRRLDFICQEMSREMNTILSKASVANISELAVRGKTEIEKIREQVQNVE